MPGSEIVNANMIIWEEWSKVMAGKLIDQHVTKSQRWAMYNKPWYDRTGGTLYDFYHYTSRGGTTIEGEVGYRSSPSKEGSKGWWLENPNQNVHAYGRGPAFGTRFQIIEKAIENDIGGLMAKLAALYGPGGFGLGTGRFTGRGLV